jgi:tryptophan-rich sensory protein
MAEDIAIKRSSFWQWFMAAVFVAACLAVGGISGHFAGAHDDLWYRRLAKPSYTPYSWLFGPVWTTLYVMMGLAAWLVWTRGDLGRVGLPLGLFALQLVLNSLWSPLFFGLHAPLLAFVDLVFLWLAIVLTTWAFFRVRAAAGWLMAPYLLWVSYAGLLNAAIVRMNY